MNVPYFRAFFRLFVATYSSIPTLCIFRT